MRAKGTLLAVLLLLGVTTGLGQTRVALSAPQQTETKPAQPATPAPLAGPLVKAEDVDSVDHILAALYDVISGPPGQRDWERFRSLFFPGARLIPTGPRAEVGYGARVLTPEEYIARAAPVLEKEGFYENEIARHTDRYGQIVQVFSTYESRHAKGEKPFTRGINSIQLMNDGKRWWVMTVFWKGEQEGSPIPPEYLK